MLSPVEEICLKFNLVPTNTRFSLDVISEQPIKDVLQPDDSTMDDIFRRLIVFNRDEVAPDYLAVWGAAKVLSKEYLIPQIVPEMTDNQIVAYQIPNSVRPLAYENIFLEPNNLEQFLRMASSIGRLVGALHNESGENMISRSSLGVIDFVVQDVEPIVIVPGLRLGTLQSSAEEIFDYYFFGCNDARMQDAFLEGYTDN